MPERMRKRMVDKEMINGENGKMLRNDPYEIRLMQNLYDAAVKQLSLKFEILNNEFKVLYARNPIHHIEGRVKAIESMVAKLRKKGLPPTIEAARESINDIAGVRVVCSYIDDVYRVAEMVERQTDIDHQTAGLYTHAKLQWVPVAAFGYPYAGVSVRSDGACDRRDTDPHDRHGLLGQFGA